MWKRLGEFVKSSFGKAEAKPMPNINIPPWVIELLSNRMPSEDRGKIIQDFSNLLSDETAGTGYMRLGRLPWSKEVIARALEEDLAVDLFENGPGEYSRVVSNCRILMTDLVSDREFDLLEGELRLIGSVDPANQDDLKKVAQWHELHGEELKLIRSTLAKEREQALERINTIQAYILTPKPRR